MTVYNVLVPVSARLQADDPKAATRQLVEALTAAGFYVYEEGINDSDAFVDEDQDAAETLLVPTCQIQHGDYDHD